METSWNFCFSTYTWFSYFSFILNYYSLFVHIPNFLNFFRCYLHTAEIFFENRTFLYPLKLKNRKIHPNENKLKLVLHSKYLKQSTCIPLSLLHLHLLQMISPTFPLFSTIFHCFSLFILNFLNFNPLSAQRKFLWKKDLYIRTFLSSKF